MGGLGSIHGLVAMGFYGFPRLWCGLDWRLAICDWRLAVTLPRPWWSLGVALGWLWGGFGVALRWLCTPEYMPSICLVYGFMVALGCCILRSAFYLRLSAPTFRSHANVVHRPGRYRIIQRLLIMSGTSAQLRTGRQASSSGHRHSRTALAAPEPSRSEPSVATPPNAGHI